MSEKSMNMNGRLGVRMAEYAGDLILSTFLGVEP
jgi:hypothetical protein